VLHFAQDFDCTVASNLATHLVVASALIHEMPMKISKTSM